MPTVVFSPKKRKNTDVVYVRIIYLTAYVLLVTADPCTILGGNILLRVEGVALTLGNPHSQHQNQLIAIHPMEGDEFLVLPGDCFRCQSAEGSTRIAQIIRERNDGTLLVYFWMHDEQQEYNLPTVLSGSNEEGVINKPTILSSLVFLHHANEIMSYSKPYTYGQKNVYCYKDYPNHLTLPPIQSISFVAGEGIGWLATELSKILSNKRQNQSSYSKSNVPITHLVWMYLRDTL